VLPAFQTKSGAVSFSAALILLLLLPILISRLPFSSRESLYNGIAPEVKYNRTLAQDVFHGTFHSDITFVGSSAMYAALSREDVIKYFSKRLNRPAVIQFLVLEYSSEDKQYLLLRDYLAHHTTSMIIASTPWRTYYLGGPSHNLSTLLRNGEYPDAFNGISTLDRIKIYCEMVVEGPTHLINLFRPNLPCSESGLDGAGISEKQEASGVVDLKIPDPHSTVSRNLVVTVNSSRIDSAQAKDDPSGYIAHFYRKLYSLSKERATPLLLINFVERSDPLDDKLRVGLPIAKIFPPNQRILAPSALDMFGRSDLTTRSRYFRDNVHLNLSGQRLFGSIVIPEIYDEYMKSISARNYAGSNIR